MKPVFAACLPLVTAACASYADLPPTSPFSAAADPVVPALAEPGPTVTYTAREIAEPGDWRGLNDAQTEVGQ